MNVAVVAEYNPFHNGHLYHIKQTRKITMANNVIAVMSGNFVQRGEPAMIDKVTRTRMALENGVDMVLELPVEYATSAADVFAGGAVDLLNRCNIIDGISFGSEIGDITAFSEIADVLNNEPEEFKKMLKTALNNGLSYPAARALALGHYLNIDISFLNSPNNILALEYVRALKRTDSKIWPYTVERVGSDYSEKELTEGFSSATAIREAVLRGDFEGAYENMPENCVKYLKEQYKFPVMDDYSSALHYIIRTTSKEELSEIADVTEGLENRIRNNVGNKRISELIHIIKTKRYTYTKLQRALLHILLGLNASECKNVPVKYIRVLGFRKSKADLLGELTRKASLPVVTNIKPMASYFEKEIRATDIYYMTTTGEMGREYTNPVVVTD